MKAFRCAMVSVVGLLAIGAIASAQTPGGQPRAGFTVESLIAQVSLYLPPEATQGMYRGFGRGGAGGAGGTSGAGQTGGQAPGGFRAQFQFTRDPKLYLTKDQITKILPVFVALKSNPMPTPSKAKEVQASVDAILTVAQKAEFSDYQKQMQKVIEQFRQQFAANGGAGAAGSGAAGGGQTGQAGQQGSGQAGALTPLERRQREVDSFVKILQDWLSQASA